MSLKLSLVYITYRHGGYDMLADALKNQTYQNYELIVVDEMVSRQKLVKDYLEDEGINVAYVGPSKKPCFPELGYNIVNSWNTGILKSTGDIIIHTEDYHWYYPNSLEKWLRWEGKFKEKTCVVCGGDMYDDNRPKNFNGLLSLWEPHWKGDSLANGCTFAFSWMPEYFETTYTAFPYELLVEMNGFLECCDCFAGLGLFEPIIERIRSVGGKIVVDPENKMQMVNHRTWPASDMIVQGQRTPEGSTVFVPRENCFDLKNHVRGS